MKITREGIIWLDAAILQFFVAFYALVNDTACHAILTKEAAAIFHALLNTKIEHKYFSSP